jgi:hypothetical protein
MTGEANVVSAPNRVRINFPGTGVGVDIELGVNDRRVLVLQLQTR